ncbi:MAG: ATP phosphoribosyltransferase regulatory subunit [Spirochaetales bacterium]|nr:ATP phosphoribosyltransferase regulatory subunit [Spirochaetales bacterium]
MKNKHNYLRNPQGTEGLYFEEADIHKQASSSLERMFSNWGYSPVKTPVFDFYDIYEPLLDRDLKSNIYRLIDRDGDLLMLRSDITLFLAKQVGRVLRDSDLPARCFYSDTILRHQDSEDVSKNEFYQTGIELIGKPDIDGDLEVLSLLSLALDNYDTDFVIHIGSRALFDLVFSSFSTEKKAEIASKFLDRNFKPVESLLESEGFEKSKEAVDLFSLILTVEEVGLTLAKYKGLFSVAVDSEIDKILSLFSQLQECGLSHELRLDLSELGTQPYYTGFVFNAYTNLSGTAVASGGRYDKLLKKFGFDASSVGFSIMTRKLDSFFKQSSSQDVEKIEEGLSFAQRYKEAVSLTSQGKRIKL